MNGNEPADLQTILFVMVCIFVACQPMWFWAENEYPNLRFWGTVGLISCIGGGLLGLFFFSQNTTMFLVVVGTLLVFVCWGWIACHYLWLILRAGWKVMAITFTLFLSVGLWLTLFSDMSWPEYWNKSTVYMFFAGAGCYVWSCASAGIIRSIWSASGSNNSSTFDDKQDSSTSVMNKREAEIKDMQKELDRLHQESEDMGYDR